MKIIPSKFAENAKQNRRRITHIKSCSLMFESNLRCDSNRESIDSRFDFAHHWQHQCLRVLACAAAGPSQDKHFSQGNIIGLNDIQWRPHIIVHVAREMLLIIGHTLQLRLPKYFKGLCSARTLFDLSPSPPPSCTASLTTATHLTTT